MATINVENLFVTENRSVFAFLNQPGQGLYIPLYQRDYSWDEDNIEQLLEDLTCGIKRIASGEITPNDKEIRFLGTLITVIEPNKNNIHPIDLQAVPARIEKVIDGQQRISTITLLAALLVNRLYEIQTKVKISENIYNEVKEVCEGWTKKIVPLFSFDLGRGTPNLKPKIIRGSIDHWTRDGLINVAYKSELSNYLASFIKVYCDTQGLEKKEYPNVNKPTSGSSLLYKNSKIMTDWLNDDVAKAHTSEDDTFANANDIIQHFTEDVIWDFPRLTLSEHLNIDGRSPQKNILCELVQTIAVCHYLLDRCCFTIIQPNNDDWAFDMFQSLNATGTPLTAIETFKPTVVNVADGIPNEQFKDSAFEANFKKVEDWLGKAESAQQKSKWTNELLTSFFASYDGRLLSTHFSAQRKVLDSTFRPNPDNTLEDKKRFVERLGNYAYFYEHWLTYTGKNKDNATVVFEKISSHQEANLISLLLLFLKASNHKMSITILAPAFERIVKNENEALNDFASVVKATAAYYFIWRSALSNSGLDNSYRDYFKQNTGWDKDAWIIRIKQVLQEKNLNTFEGWRAKAHGNLRYDKTTTKIVQLALLIVAHDTIADSAEVGLMKKGRDGVDPYLKVENWLSRDLKTIEHIAPQANDSELWDAALYTLETELYQVIGNLTLLPANLNTSAGCRGWKEKFFYYKAISETDPVMLNSIGDEAISSGVSLNNDTILLLKLSQYKSHLKSILSVGSDGLWDKAIVEKRTERMLDIIWQKVAEWIPGLAATQS